MKGYPRVGSRRRAVAAQAIVGSGLVLSIAGPGLSLGGLGAALVLGGALVSPLAGLQAVVASLPFYLFARQAGGQSISPTELTLLLVTLATGIRKVAAFLPSSAACRHASRTARQSSRTARQSSLTARQSPLTARHSPRASGLSHYARFDLPLALFLAGALLSLLATEYLRLSLRELRTLIVEPILFFMLCRAVVHAPADVGRLVATLLLVTGVVAAGGLAQLALGVGLTEAQGVQRVQATYTSPNQLALLLGRALPFLLAAVWLLPRWRVPAVVVGTLCLACQIATFSVGGWIGTAAALLVVVGRLGNRRLLAALVVAGAILGAATLTLAPVERLAGRFDPTRGTTFARVQLWQAALALIRDQPFVGIGLDNFLYRYQQYAPPSAGMEPNLSHPHNLLLQFWLQLGLLGVLALLALLWRLGRALWPWTDRGASVLERALAIGALGSLADFVVHGLVDNSYFLVDMAVIFWLTVTVAAILADPYDRRGDAPVSASPAGVQSRAAAPT
ncbi:MAG: O-antigen ligase family protein [Chloroflexi bacterium]|nr:O-antigen ligase family protein [Chloroflexota bacterium]